MNISYKRTIKNLIKINKLLNDKYENCDDEKKLTVLLNLIQSNTKKIDNYHNRRWGRDSISESSQHFCPYCDYVVSSKETTNIKKNDKYTEKMMTLHYKYTHKMSEKEIISQFDGPVEMELFVDQGQLELI